jgi:hypothetical protein
MYNTALKQVVSYFGKLEIICARTQIRVRTLRPVQNVHGQIGLYWILT